MAVPARHFQQTVEVCKEDRVIDRKGKRDVAKMPWTMDIVQSTRATQLLLVAWPQSWVVQPANVRMEQAVKRVWVDNGLSADAMYL